MEDLQHMTATEDEKSGVLEYILDMVSQLAVMADEVEECGFAFDLREALARREAKRGT